VKLVSPDRAFIYYLCDRADGKSQGIRFGRAAGAIGFVSETPLARQRHPIRFEAYDNPPIQLPIGEHAVPPIMQNILGEIEDEHPEVGDLLVGKISFDGALR
jgi:hypothetical protein